MTSNSAVISPCGQYRYTLYRATMVNNPRKGKLIFCMLNPSTADADLDDPTIRRCRGFSDSLGYDGFEVVNLYAYRATKPATLKTVADPVGPDNDYWIRMASEACNDVVMACGTNADKRRLRQVCEIFINNGCQLYCLGTTKDGFPQHPLYIAGNTPLKEYIYAP